MELIQFIEAFQEAITHAVLTTYPPLYSARNRNDWGFDLRQLRRRPLGAQGYAIRAVAVSLQRHRGTNLVGEMGTGKTTIAARRSGCKLGRRSPGPAHGRWTLAVVQSCHHASCG